MLEYGMLEYGMLEYGIFNKETGTFLETETVAETETVYSEQCKKRAMEFKPSPLLP